MPDEPQTDPGYEPRDANVRYVWLFAGGLTTTLVVAGLVVAFLLSLFQKESGIPGPATRNAGPENFPPPPRLQVNDQAELAALRDAQFGKLSTYGWIDRAAGTVHIPIDYAIELTAQRGLPPADIHLTPVEMRQQKARTP